MDENPNHIDISRSEDMHQMIENMDDSCCTISKEQMVSKEVYTESQAIGPSSSDYEVESSAVLQTISCSEALTSENINTGQQSKSPDAIHSLEELPCERAIEKVDSCNNSKESNFNPIILSVCGHADNCSDTTIDSISQVPAVCSTTSSISFASALNKATPAPNNSTDVGHDASVLTEFSEHQTNSGILDSNVSNEDINSLDSNGPTSQKVPIAFSNSETPDLPITIAHNSNDGSSSITIPISECPSGISKQNSESADSRDPIKITFAPDCVISKSTLSSLLSRQLKLPVNGDQQKKQVVVKRVLSNVNPSKPAKPVRIVLKNPEPNASIRIPISCHENSSRFISNTSNINIATDPIHAEVLVKSIMNLVGKEISKLDFEVISRQEVLESGLLDIDKRKRLNCGKPFSCSICGEEFDFEEFINDHMVRRAFVLTYFCNGCSKNLTFYNKCSFWVHLKNDYPQGFDMEKLKNETSTFSWKPYAGTYQPSMIIPAMPDLKCKNCKECFYFASEVQCHFKKSLQIYNCNQCFLPLVNACASVAHSKIHAGTEKELTCPECGLDFDVSKGLKCFFDHLDSCNHFNMDFAFVCKCKQLFLSATDFRAHILKSHVRLLYVCKSCNRCFSLFDKFYSHCSAAHNMPWSFTTIAHCENCDHGSKSVGNLKSHLSHHVKEAMPKRLRCLMCFVCKAVFKDSSSLNDHIEKEHSHKPNRCTICFGLFKSRQNLVMHIVSNSCSQNRCQANLRICIDSPESLKPNIQEMCDDLFKTNIPSAHPARVIPVPSGKSSSAVKNVLASEHHPLTRNDGKKMQCHTCKICLIGSNNYQRHMELHNSSGPVHHQTHCGVCKKTVVDSQIESHMETHQKRGIIVCSLCHSRNFESMEDALTHSKNMCYYPEVDNDGASFIETREIEPNSAQRDESHYTSLDHARDMGNQPSNSKKNAVEEASVFPCLMCGLAFSCKAEKEDHVSRVHDGTRILYFCLVCKKRGNQKCFSRKNLVIKHISHKHRIVNPSDITKAIHEEEQNVTSGLVVSSGSNNESDTAPPPKRLRLDDDGEFLCGKCGFSCEDSKVFSDHIHTHNPKKEPQCPECGLCFTVLAALKKHLFVVHKIKDMDTFLMTRGIEELEPEADMPEEETDWDEIGLLDSASLSSEPTAVSDKREKSLTKNKNECNVCYRKFSSESKLKTHMRNHGMAFIRSKRHNDK